MATAGEIAVALGVLALACTAIAEARADDVPTLILATALPPGNPLADQVLHPWADRVNAAADGKLKIDIRDGMAIASLTNSYDRVVADDFQNGVEGFASVPFLVRNDSGIGKMDDLKGRVLATNAIGGAFDVGMRIMLKKHGLEDKRDYTVVESDYAHMNAMILERKADLVIGAQPWARDPAIREATHTLFIMRDATGGRTQVLVFAARAGFVEKNRAALIDFFTDMLALSRWFHEPAHRQEAITLAARVTKQPYERLDSYLFSTSDFYSDPKGLPDVGALQSGIDMMVALGFAKKSIDVRRYLDLTLVQEAAKRLP